MPTASSNTRERLVNAAIALMRRDGADAVTTTRVAKKAGITQSGFYRHFTTIEECQRAAAGIIAAQVRALVQGGQARLRALPQTPELDALSDHLGSVLDAAAHERGFVMLFARNEHHESPVGQVMRTFRDELASDLTAHLHALSLAFGARPEHQSLLRMQAELILAQVIGACIGVARGDFGPDERPTLARQLARSVHEGTAALFRSLPSTLRRPA